MAIDPEVIWEKFLTQHRQMVHFLTVLSEDNSTHEMLQTLYEFGPEAIMGLVISLGNTLEGALRYIAYMEGNTLQEQLQSLALRTESYTREEVTEIVRDMETKIVQDMEANDK